MDNKPENNKGTVNPEESGVGTPPEPAGNASANLSQKPEPTSDASPSQPGESASVTGGPASSETGKPEKTKKSKTERENFYGNAPDPEPIPVQPVVPPVQPGWVSPAPVQQPVAYQPYTIGKQGVQYQPVVYAQHPVQPTAPQYGVQPPTYVPQGQPPAQPVRGYTPPQPPQGYAQPPYQAPQQPSYGQPAAAPPPQMPQGAPVYTQQAPPPNYRPIYNPPNAPVQYMPAPVPQPVPQYQQQGGGAVPILYAEAQTAVDTAPHKRALRRASNRNSLMLLAFWGISMLVVFMVGMFLEVLLKNAGSNASLYTLIAEIAMYLVIGPIVLIAFNFRRERHVHRSFAKPQMSGGKVAKWVVIIMGCTYATSFFFNIIFNMLENAFSFSRYSGEGFSASLTLFDNATLFLFVGLLGPLIEELYFRASHLRTVAPFGGWFAVVSSGIMFGLLHANHKQIFFATTMGILAGYVTLKARSIWPALITHILFNTIGVIQSIAQEYIDLDFLANPGRYDFGAYISEHILPFIAIFGTLILTLILALVGIVLLIVEICTKRQEMRLGNGCRALTGGQKFVTYFFTSPATIVLLVLLLGMTIYNLF